MPLHGHLGLIGRSHVLHHVARGARLDLRDQAAQFFLGSRVTLQQVGQAGPPDDLLLGSRPLQFGA
jgi:hypothetical protein